MGAVAAGTEKKAPAVGLPEGAASVDRAGGKDVRVSRLPELAPPRETAGADQGRRTEPRH